MDVSAMEKKAERASRTRSSNPWSLITMATALREGQHFTAISFALSFRVCRRLLTSIALAGPGVRRDTSRMLANSRGSFLARTRKTAHPFHGRTDDLPFCSRLGSLRIPSSAQGLERRSWCDAPDASRASSASFPAVNPAPFATASALRHLQLCCRPHPVPTPTVACFRPCFSDNRLVIGLVLQVAAPRDPPLRRQLDNSWTGVWVHLLPCVFDKDRPPTGIEKAHPLACVAERPLLCECTGSERYRRA